MFSYEEGRAFDAWYTKEPTAIATEPKNEPVDVSVISEAPIYRGNKVIVTDYGYMAFLSELDELIDFQLDEYKKDELIDVLEAFSGEGIKIYLKAKIIEYINIFKKQNRMNEVMEILQFEEGRAWE
ncbi:hypothetical protein CIRMBP1310_01706 [Enterococcus cecorum]|uniref:hypothetical protein n=1 Tax=Enterococcus cecorum TaxID=44008 RepID=UPI000ABC64B2|nr:hypothetical protein [Enterococcus cecorum]MCJ0535925.1 hypothetical protein [Enterococcus cecorum]MCJ0554974.1 hypothetical protein [Enterococcus cecorum]CAI3480261.1 hypothetical protein CIRMBP1310_01706 [Enterococcus cecorum]CAI3503022.1 hypothetical protein CIRMBP1311_02109 [Enterococcus cecorum]